jgi:hypothetical protein
VQDCDLESIAHSVRSFAFPAGVNRIIASDMESTAVYVILTSADHFLFQAFRVPLTSPEVHSMLAEAVGSLADEGPPAPFRIDVSRMGRDM